MVAQFIQNGDTIDYTPGSDVEAGQVLDFAPGVLAVAIRPIPANTLGALAIRGVFEAPLGDAENIQIGTNLYWDVSSKVARSDSAAGILMGRAVKAASSPGDATVQVLLGW